MPTGESMPSGESKEAAEQAGLEALNQEMAELMRDARRDAIIEELEAHYEANFGPIDIPLTPKEIEDAKARAASDGREWDGLTTKLTPAGSEFYFDHAGGGVNSVPNQAERILQERFPEYRDEPLPERPQHTAPTETPRNANDEMLERVYGSDSQEDPYDLQPSGGF